MAPPALPSEGGDALDRRVGNRRELDVLAGVGDGGVELIEQGDARGAGRLRERQPAVRPSRGPGRSSAGSRGNMKL